MVIYENGRSLGGYPRLDGLAFRVRDLQPVRDSLDVRKKSEHK